MKLFKNKKHTRRFGIVLAGTLLFTTAIYGKSLTQKIDATFRNIQVYYNNQQKTMAQEPFIYNGSVYLPVRAVSELVDKDVHWDSAKNGVYVADKGGFSSSNTLVQQLQSEVAAKNFEIAKISAEKSALESKIKDLEKKVDDQGSKGDVKDTLRVLEDTFATEYGIAWEFYLTETSSRVNVEVSLDSRNDERRWDRLTTRERERFFKDICREIRFDHKDAYINGKVLDRRTDSTIGTFTYSKSDSFSYDNKGSSSFYDLERDFARVFKDINGTVNVDAFTLEGNEDNITFTVTVDLKSVSARNAWNTLEDDEISGRGRTIRNFMMNIEEELRREFKYATIEGYIVDYANRNETIAIYERGTLIKPR